MLHQLLQARRQGWGGGGGGVRGGSLEPPFWPPKDFIYTAIAHFKCPVMKNLDPPENGPPSSDISKYLDPGPDVSKYLDPHGTNISEIG